MNQPTLKIPSIQEQNDFTKRMKDASSEEERKKLLKEEFGQNRRIYELKQQTINTLVQRKNESEQDISVMINTIIENAVVDPEEIIVGSLNLVLTDDNIKKLEEIADKTRRKRGSKFFGASTTRVLDHILTKAVK